MKHLIIGLVAGGAIVGSVWVISALGSTSSRVDGAESAALDASSQNLSPAAPDSRASAARIRELEAIVEDQAAKLTALTSSNEQLRRVSVEKPATELTTIEKVEVETDKDGNVLAKGMTRNGVRFGPWEFWHSNGQKAKEGKYIEGQRFGIWKTWRVDGSYESVGRYVDDLKEGPWTFIENGVMQDFEMHLGKDRHDNS